jgi:exosome complex exonuclease DIS3/RRP44
MDLLTALPAELPIIIPSTTIRETRHRSLPLSNRLQQLVQDEDRCVCVWWNEERRETATAAVEEEDEVVNDRNDRGGLLQIYLDLTPSDPPDTPLLPRAPGQVGSRAPGAHSPHR